MARAVRKKELTAEERLAAALVPEEEQPYKVPGNWCWVRLGSVIEASKEKADIFEEGTRYVGLENIEKDTGVISCQMAESIKSTKTIFHEGDILYGKLRPYLNKHGIVDFDGVCSTDILAFNAKGTSINRYVDFYLHLPNFIESMVANSKGINLPRVSEKVVLSYPLPLAPLSEQQRLVDIISSLFADLDEAKEKLTAVVEGFAQRKAAILHQAFTGELTAKWREENGRKNEWEEVTLDSVCKSIFDGDHQPPPKSEEGIPFLVISNVNTGYLSFDNTRYVTREYYDALSETRKAEEGDVLYTLVGSYGIPVVVDSNKPFCFQRHMALLKPAKINTRFLWYQLQSYEFYNKATEIATGTAQLTVPIKGLRKLTIKTTSDEEQAEVVNTLDSLLFAEQQAQSAVETVLADIDTLKKSILARAFRGELSTNDPGEENAVEMLKEVMKKG